MAVRPQLGALLISLMSSDASISLSGDGTVAQESQLGCSGVLRLLSFVQLRLSCVGREVSCVVNGVSSSREGVTPVGHEVALLGRPLALLIG
jgi:hypothetical protein